MLFKFTLLLHIHESISPIFFLHGFNYDGYISSHYDLNVAIWMFYFWRFKRGAQILTTHKTWGIRKWTNQSDVFSSFPWNKNSNWLNFSLMCCTMQEYSPLKCDRVWLCYLHLCSSVFLPQSIASLGSHTPN